MQTPLLRRVVAIVVVALATWGFSTSMSAAQAPVVLRSSTDDAAARGLVKALNAADPAKPVALVFENSELTPEAVTELLIAIDDRRRAGGSTTAVLVEGGPGEAIVALACNAMVLVADARLRGDSDWCTSPSRRDIFAARLRLMSKVDELLTNRFLDARKPLRWSKVGGFSDAARPSNPEGDLPLADADDVLSLTFATSVKLGLRVQEAGSVESALALLGGPDARNGRRPDAPPPSRKPGELDELPTGKGQSSTPKSGDDSDDEGSGVGKDDGNSDKPAGSKVDHSERIAGLMAEYTGHLKELQSQLRQLDEYYEGDAGIWTESSKSLKAVWRNKNQTKDRRTVDAMADLQAGIKSNCRNMKMKRERVIKFARESGIAPPARLENDKQAIDGIHDAIDRNRWESYEKYLPQVLRL